MWTIRKSFLSFFLTAFVIFSPIFLICCGDSDDNPKEKNEEIGNSNNIHSANYDPNSDHALSLCLKENGYGSIMNCNIQTAIIGSWLPVSYCAMYYSVLEYNQECDYYGGGYMFRSDGVCYYLDENGNMESGGHSWSIENNEMLRIYWKGTSDERIYLKMTTNGYLIMNWHGGVCWKIYRKI